MNDLSDLKAFMASLLRPIINEAIKENFENQKNLNAKNKEFYTPKEFSHLTGIKYSTVIYRCKIGMLKARQDTPGSTWQIDSNELDRYRNEATDNYSSSF